MQFSTNIGAMSRMKLTGIAGFGLGAAAGRGVAGLLVSVGAAGFDGAGFVSGRALSSSPLTLASATAPSRPKHKPLVRMTAQDIVRSLLQRQTAWRLVKTALGDW
jgi:hypothetical protein